MADECKHPAYALIDGDLKCVGCGAPSPSPKWRENVFGRKVVEQSETENKGRFWPSESKRISPPRGPAGKFSKR